MRASLLAILLLALSCRAYAQPPFELTLTTESDEARAHFVDGLEHFNDQQIARAREAFERALAFDPEFATARGYLALSMNYTGNVAEQWRLAASSVENASRIEQKLLDAHQAWGNQSYGDARDAMLAVIETAPQSRQAHYELGWFYYKMGDFVAANDAASEVLTLDRSFMAAHILLARSYLGARDFPGAEAAIKNALELDPESALAHTVRGDIFSEQRKTDEAIRAYERALAIDEHAVPAMSGRARAMRTAGEYESAFAAFRDLCDTVRDLPDGAYKEHYLDWSKAEDACFDYGMTYLLAGDHAQATRIFEEIAEYTYENRIENAPIFYNALARFYLESGRLTLAESLYDRGLEVSEEADLSPYMRRLWNGRHVHATARIRARQGRFDESLALVAELKSRIDDGGEQGEPFLPAYHYLLGYVLLEQQKYDKALEHLKQSSLDEPYNRWLLSRAHDGAGNRKEARAIGEELAALAPFSYGHALVIADVRKWLAAHRELH